MRNIRQIVFHSTIDRKAFWKPMHLQEPYKAALRQRINVTDSLWYRIVTFLCSTRIKDRELKQVSEAAREVMNVSEISVR